MKTISIFLALVNSLLAGVLITFLVTSMDFQYSMVWWSAARIILALSIITVGVFSWIETVVPVQPSLLVPGSLFLVAIGPATIVWAYHRATMTGDMEYYMLMYGASLFIQGIAILFGLSDGKGNTSIA